MASQQQHHPASGNRASPSETTALHNDSPSSIMAVSPSTTTASTMPSESTSSTSQDRHSSSIQWGPAITASGSPSLASNQNDGRTQEPSSGLSKDARNVVIATTSIGKGVHRETRKTPLNNAQAAHSYWRFSYMRYGKGVRQAPTQHLCGLSHECDLSRARWCSTTWQRSNKLPPCQYIDMKHSPSDLHGTNR